MGARWSEPTDAIHAINSCRESHVRRAFTINERSLLAPRPPVYPIRDIFLRLNTLLYFPDKEAGEAYV
jgi:hypothetical protein